MERLSSRQLLPASTLCSDVLVGTVGSKSSVPAESSRCSGRVLFSLPENHGMLWLASPYYKLLQTSDFRRVQ